MKKWLEELCFEIENNDWCIDVDEKNKDFTLRKYSDLGEDFNMNLDLKDTLQEQLQEIKKHAEDFDPEDHASFYIENRGKYGIPNSIQELLDDAKSLKKYLIELKCNLLKKFEV